MADVYTVKVGETEYQVDGATSYEDAVAIALGGAQPLPDAPEIYSEGTMLPTSEEEVRNEKLRGMMMLATEPEEQIAVFQEFFPEAETELVRDEYILARGSDPITGDDFEGYINKPGPSPRDLTQTLGQLAVFSPGGRMANLITRPVGRMAVSGLAEGLTEAGRQAFVDHMTAAEVPFSPGAMALAAAGGTGGEALGEAASFAGRFFRNAAYYNKDGLTERGRAVLEKTGIDPDLVDDNPQLLQALRRKPGLPTPRVALAAMSGERPDMIGNVKVTGKSKVPTGAGKEALDELRRLYDVDKTNVNDLYELAKATDATLNRYSVHQGFKDVKQALAEDAFVINKGPIKQALDHFKNDVYKAKGLENVNKFSVKGYEIWRKKVSGMRQNLGKSKRQDKRGLSQLIHQMDQKILATLQHGVAHGDPDAVRLWNEAISGNAAFMDKWTSNSILEDAVTTGKTPAHFAKIMLSTTGKVSERQGALKAAKEILGEDSEAWESLRSEYMTQILRKGQPDMDTFNPSNFATVLSKIVTQEPDVIGTVLKADEIKILKDISRLATEKPTATLLSTLGDLIYIRHGVDGSAISGAMRRTAIRSGLADQSERPLFAQIGATSGAAAAKEEQ